MKRPKLKLKTARKWVVGEDKRLIEMTLAGEPIQQIAKTMARSNIAIKVRAAKLGLSIARNKALRFARNNRPSALGSEAPHRHNDA